MKINIIQVAFDNYLNTRKSSDPKFREYVDSLHPNSYLGFYNMMYSVFHAGYIRALENNNIDHRIV